MLVAFVTVVLIERISAIHRDNDGVLGVRTMWHALHRDGICCDRLFGSSVVTIR
ncbi:MULTISPECIES: IS3 family transposase [Corynebacterium]|uniref:IS3 family transposase n=1 Tax=Corynebacterium TaxID=1716 RepID=UPI00345F11FC